MKKFKIFIALISLFLIIVLIFSAYNIIKILNEYNKAKTLYSDIQEQYIDSVEDIATQDTIEKSPPKDDNQSLPISIDFKALIEHNEDVVGWIYSPNEIINYPVVQSDNNTYYLNKDINGNYLINGTIFADYRNHSVAQDLNYIIYGHSMNNQSMFGTLLNYKNQSYYDKYPSMYYLTPEQNYRIELLAGSVVSHNDKIYQTSPDSDLFQNYIEELCMKSTFKSKNVYEYGDNVVTLSTCSYEYDDARYVVIGKIVKI